MAYPDNLLVRGERVIVRKRPHWKVLILPTILFIVIIGGAFALAAWLRNWQYSTQANYVIAGVAVIALIVLVIVPFIRWRTEHFVITNHHVFFRTGLLSRREHQIPLGQIANMETEVTFWGRLMGYGSLIVESSADQPLKFRNVASLSKVQSQLNQLIRDERERSQHPDRFVDEDDEPAPSGQPQQVAQYPPASYPQQGYPTQAQPPGYPPQQQGYPTQQGHPTQQGYPTQQAYPAQPGYPAQQANPTQAYPAQQGYPAQPGYVPQSGGAQQAYPVPPGYPPPGAADNAAPTSNGSSPAPRSSESGQGGTAQQS